MSKKATLSEKATLSKVNYRHYPEYMFAIVAAYLPEREGDDLNKWRP
jgi:hypothetical protein